MEPSNPQLADALEALQNVIRRLLVQDALGKADTVSSNVTGALENLALGASLVADCRWDHNSGPLAREDVDLAIGEVKQYMRAITSLGDRPKW